MKSTVVLFLSMLSGLAYGVCSDESSSGDETCQVTLYDSLLGAKSGSKSLAKESLNANCESWKASVDETHGDALTFRSCGFAQYKRYYRTETVYHSERCWPDPDNPRNQICIPAFETEEQVLDKVQAKSRARLRLATDRAFDSFEEELAAETFEEWIELCTELRTEAEDQLGDFRMHVGCEGEGLNKLEFQENMWRSTARIYEYE